MFNVKLLFPLAALLLTFGGCDKNETHEKNTDQTVKKVDTSLIQLRSIDNNSTLTLKKTKNGLVLQDAPQKLLIIDIFATWCPPCKAEAKILSDIAKKFPKKVKIVGVTIERNIKDEALEKFEQENELTYTLVNSPKNDDVIETVSKNLQIGERFPIPLVVIYKDGKVFQNYLGATEEEFILSDIKEALKNNTTK